MTGPTNPQNFNRYSYVLNNPLSYTDPTGFDDTKCQVNQKAAQDSRGSDTAVTCNPNGGGDGGGASDGDKNTNSDNNDKGDNNDSSNNGTGDNENNNDSDPRSGPTNLNNGMQCVKCGSAG